MHVVYWLNDDNTFQINSKKNFVFQVFFVVCSFVLNPIKLFVQLF